MENQPIFMQLKKQFPTLSDYDLKEIASHVLACKPTELFTMFEISKQQQKKIAALANQVLKGKPVQYVVGNVEFFNCIISVNKHVLIPRSETELLTDMVVKHIQNQQTQLPMQVLDLCCGSGAIGIAVAKNTQSVVTCSDISKKALKMAKQNAKQNNTVVQFVKSNLFHHLGQKFQVIVSNPPYIAKDDVAKLDGNVKNHEPHLALVGGRDGLCFYREIAKQAPEHLVSGGALFLEIGMGQEEEVCKLLQPHFTQITIVPDYEKVNRFIFAKKG